MSYGISLPASFPAWCGVETLSVAQQPQLVFGLASEQSVAGVMFLRLDVPAVNDEPAKTLLLAPAVIRRIEPMNEEDARRLMTLRHKSKT